MKASTSLVIVDSSRALPTARQVRAGRWPGRHVRPLSGAHHGFDVTTLTRPTLVPDARQGRGATIAYDPAALRDAEKKLREFLRRHLGR